MSDATAALGSNVGVAWVSLRFSARGAAAQIRSQLAGETAGLGATLGNNVGKSMNKSFSSQLKGFGSTLTAAGKKLSTHLTLPIVAAAAESIHMAATFQASMTKVRTQAGASQKEVDKMSAAILRMGRHSQQGPEKLSEALYHLESLGLRGAKALRALRQSEDLANVSGADMEQTTSAIGAAWRSGIKGASSFSKTAATLNAIVGAGNMRMSDLLGALGTGILPAARSFGVSLKSVGGALATMTDEGVPAVDAATRLRMSLSLMGAPSKQAEGVLNGIGLTGTKLATAMRGPQGLLGAIQLLHDHMKGLSKVAQAQLISRAFGGGRSSGAITTLLNQLNVVGMKTKQVQGGISKFGASIAKQATTSSAKFAEFKSAVQDLGISIGNKLLPFFTSLTTKLTGLVNDFGGLSKGTQKWILILAGIAAAVGPLLMVLGSMAKGVSAIISIGKATRIFSAQMWILNAAMDANPVGIVLLAVEALGVAFVIAWTKSKTFRKIVEDVFTFIGHLAKHIFYDVVIPAVKFFWNIISTVFGNIIHAAATAFGWVPGLGGKLKAADAAFQRFRDGVNRALSGINDKHVNVNASLSLSPLTGAGKAARAKQLIYRATGGPVRGPGGPKGDKIPALLSDNEFVMRNEAVRKYGVGFMEAINAGRFANGGLAVRTHFPSLRGVPGDMLSWISKHVSINAMFGGGGSYSGGVRQWAPLVSRVLAMLGLPGSYLGMWLAQIGTESGGNPRAINLTDSNAAMGDPSRGLLQTIMSTFLAYAGPFRGLGIYNPLANVFAAINYAKHRYGALGMAGVIGHGHGYDGGGIARGLGLLPKYTPKPERVLSPKQTSAFERLVDAISGKGGNRGPSRMRVEFDPRTMEMWIRDLGRQEAHEEIRFATR